MSKSSTAYLHLIDYLHVFYAAVVQASSRGVTIPTPATRGQKMLGCNPMDPVSNILNILNNRVTVVATNPVKSVRCTKIMGRGAFNVPIMKRGVDRKSLGTTGLNIRGKDIMDMC